MAELISDEKSRVITGPTILLSNGQYFDFLDPGASRWGVEELAVALGKCCRFAGHCRGFYSVAEHSVHVAALVPPEHRLAALLHDAHEAFTGDITYPLKRLIGDAIRPIEARIDAVLFARFGVPLPLDESIKRADRLMLWLEQRLLMGNADEWSATLPPDGQSLPEPEGWHWNAAAARWGNEVFLEIGKRVHHG
jgi:hypothetical protein